MAFGWDQNREQTLAKLQLFGLISNITFYTFIIIVEHKGMFLVHKNVTLPSEMGEQLLEGAASAAVFVDSQ